MDHTFFMRSILVLWEQCGRENKFAWSFLCWDKYVCFHKNFSLFETLCNVQCCHCHFSIAIVLWFYIWHVTCKKPFPHAQFCVLLLARNTAQSHILTLSNAKYSISVGSQETLLRVKGFTKFTQCSVSWNCFKKHTSGKFLKTFTEHSDSLGSQETLLRVNGL